jgi:hypothetical protein
MKKILVFFVFALLFSSCGNDSKIKEDVKRMVELKCKMKESFDKIMELNKKVQGIDRSNLTDLASIQRVSEEQKKITDELIKIKADDNKLLEEFKVLENEMKTKYSSDADKEKVKKELATQLSVSACM